MDNLDTLKQQLQQQQKLASLGMLSAGIAHEIQNPLNFVIWVCSAQASHTKFRTR